ncbi:topoisomerase [Clostridia bacterium]|nr:topoisomerase [Clostridia bacterium]
MNNVTSEQIEQARQIDLLDYLLANEGDNIRKVGNEYRLRDHDSLAVSNGKFHWHSCGIGGSNCIDYLTKVRGFSFVEAVQSLVGENFQTYSTSTVRSQECKPRKFILPAFNRDNDKIIAYLQRRGISLQTIQECIQGGLMYEDTRHNCVFVGFDEHGYPRFAALRGTYSDFKCDVKGSDKRFNFLLPAVKRESPLLAVFEAPIDVLSHKTAYPDWEGCRLSLGGVALAALEQFLSLHGQIGIVYVCTDNDKAGDDCAARIAERFRDVKVQRVKPPQGKDWNDFINSSSRK